MSIFARLFRDNRPAGYRNSETPDTFADEDNNNFRHGINHHDDDFDDDDDDSGDDGGDDGGGDDGGGD